MEKKLKNILTQLGQTTLSIFKILLQSRPSSQMPCPAPGIRELVVLGNGPSLRPFIEQKSTFFEGRELMAVNYAVLSDYFTRIRPRYYILADPAFYDDPQHRDKVFTELGKVIDWEMDLFLSSRARVRQSWKPFLKECPNIRIHYFNMTPVEGFPGFTRFVYKHGLGMPRPRNVLIPAIMTALRMDFDTIYVAGADHSWMREYWVNDENRVVEDLNHFYDKKGSVRYVSPFPLHDLLWSMATAFRSYHQIRNYAQSQGKRIINITEGSYIDAFERMKIE